MLKTGIHTTGCTTYRNDTGVSESCLILIPESNFSFEDTLHSLYLSMIKAYASFDLREKIPVFTRFFFSDIKTQKQQLLGSPLYEIFQDGACSFIQQPPLSGAPLAVLSYYIGPNRKTFCKYRVKNGTQNSLLVDGENYSLYVSCNLSVSELFNTYKQTLAVFDNYSKDLTGRNMTLSNHTIRTWVFVDDIDDRYMEMVEARRDFFSKCGLTQNTHYIASTGIEGRIEKPYAIVDMDTIAFKQIVPRQINYLSAPTHMNPTHEYGVTFERGIKLDFGDRTHYYISGTASIDKNGQVLYIDDIRNQTRRAVENINALLQPDEMTINDMAYLIIYLRNPFQYSEAREVLDTILDRKLLRIYLQAKVCRPTWLIEIEAFGIKDASLSFPAFL